MRKIPTTPVHPAWTLLPTLLLLAACGGAGGGTTDAAAAAAPSAPGGGGTPAAAFAVLSMAPTEIDRDLGARVELTGAGMREPLRLTFVGEDGRTVGDPVDARVRGGGARATVDVPPLPGLGARETCRVIARNGDGSEIDDLAAVLVRDYRTLDGTRNHETQTAMGSAGIELRRWVVADYADGVSALAGPERPNPRSISNAVCAQTESRANPVGASDMFWQWGQFVDHDVDLTPAADPAEHADIAVPAGDPDFDPFSSGAVVIPFDRSTWAAGSAPRQQTNEITAWIDASNVYGSDETRSLALRTLDGTGRLKTSAGDLLPFNEPGLPNAGGTDAGLFLAGDVRANEQVGLTTLHTLFVREHNRLAGEIRARAPDLPGDEVFEEARRVVAAELQVITYEEFLPVLLGPGAIPPYAGYDASVDAGIANLFSTAAYRLGHSLLSSTLLRLDANGNEIPEGHLALRDAYFNPDLLVTQGGIEPLLRGLAAQTAQDLDLLLVDDVRSFLFGPPGAGGLDLAALNLQRGRDHGLPTYNDAREGFGLPRKGSFAEVSSDPDVQVRLAAAYDSIDHVDVWIGALAEDDLPGALVGELLGRVLTRQFRSLRDGDRFWYERVFSGEERDALRATRLADVIRRNTPIAGELQDDVFHVPGPRPPAATQPAPLTEVREDRLRRWRGEPPPPR